MPSRSTLLDIGNDDRTRNQVLWAAAAVAFLVVASSLVLMRIEDWDFWRSLFFTLITITTVGYGDEGISPDGQKFASFLMVVGIGLTTYLFALMVQWILMSRFAWRKRMQKRIDQLEGHTIVCGFGRMGRPTCRELAAARSKFVVIDNVKEHFADAVEAGYLALEGNAVDDSVLIEAGIERAAHLVASVADGSQNIVITLSARALKHDVHVVARAERNDEERKLLRAGAQRVVRPFESGGLAIANSSLRPHAAALFDELIDSGLGLSFGEVNVHAGSALDGVCLADYGRSDGDQINFVALKRDEKDLEITPRGSEELAPGDVLVVAGDPSQVELMVERGCVD